MAKYSLKSKLRKEKIKEIALERITRLFNEARTNPAFADRYVEIARKIAMKANIPVPSQFKRKFCKHCNIYFRTGNYRVRTRSRTRKSKMVVYYCFNCKKYMRFKI